MHAAPDPDTEDPDDERDHRVEVLLRIALAAAGVSALASLLFFFFGAMELVPENWEEPIWWVVAAAVVLIGGWVYVRVARFANERVRKIGLQGTVTVGRVCAELIAVVVVLGAPAVWRTTRELYEWWSYLRPIEDVEYLNVVFVAVTGVAICVIGVVWALCPRDELPSAPLFPEGDDD